VVHGFQFKSQEVEVTAVGSSTRRTNYPTLSGKELTNQLRSDRAELSTLDEPFLKNVYSATGQIGTKVAMLLQEIRSMMRKSATSKCVVFTQFLGILDVAGAELAARNIGFVRIDGNCKQYERADALMAFDSNPSVRVFLLSMRSGAVGLNLTAADHCFIMDTAQNPAIEEQGIDRIHRIGQTKPVTVKRFVMRGTVEERLLGVRRKLGVDRTVGTQVNGVEEDEAENRRPRKKARTSEDETMDAQQQKRVETLETLFGCKMHVHKA
jgi:SNF2 family DNA or RNA helicase